MARYHFLIFFIFIFRTLYTVFNSGCTGLHSYEQCRWDLFSPHPQEHFLIFVILMIALLTTVSWYLSVVLICISLMINDVAHVSMCLLAICNFFGGENMYSAPLPNYVYFYLIYFKKLKYNLFEILYWFQVYSIVIQ